MEADRSQKIDWLYNIKRTLINMGEPNWCTVLLERKNKRPALAHDYDR